MDAQRLDPARDELVLNTNFSHDQAARWLRGRTGRALENHETAQGPFYAAALRSVRSEVVAFLDDDDRWSVDRLSAVRRAFQQDPTLVYFHNEQTRIDAQGHRLPGRRPAVRFSRRAPRGPRALRGPIRDADLQELLQRAAFFNLSSTCVRAIAVRPYLPYLDRMSTCEDSFFFYASVLSGGSFRLDDRPFTDYREHATNVSREWRRLPPGASGDTWPDRAVASHLVLLDMAHGSGRSDVISAVEHDLAVMRLLQDVARRPPSRQRSGEDLLALLRRYRVGHWPLNAGFAALGASQLVSPMLGRFVHGRLKK